jgi:hypothetical protein
MIQMKHLILAAAATVVLFNSAIAQEQASNEGALGADANRGLLIAMGPVSAPQKRSPVAPQPNSDRPACKPSAKLCLDQRSNSGYRG